MNKVPKQWTHNYNPFELKYGYDSPSYFIHVKQNICGKFLNTAISAIVPRFNELIMWVRFEANK